MKYTLEHLVNNPALIPTVEAKIALMQGIQSSATMLEIISACIEEAQTEQAATQQAIQDGDDAYTNYLEEHPKHKAALDKELDGIEKGLWWPEEVKEAISSLEQ